MSLEPITPARRRGRTAGAAAFAVAAHVAVLLVVVGASPDAPVYLDPPPMTVSLLTLEPPRPPAPPAPDPAPAEPAKAPEPPRKAKPKLNVRPPKVVPPPQVRTLPVPPPKEKVNWTVLGESELAGAITASGSGGGGGEGAGGGGSGGGSGSNCNMVQRLQAALRRDPDVRAAAARAHQEAGAAAKAIVLWNGSWIRNPGQEGKGLAGIRQAIIMEVGFAPEACRRDPVRGRVVISLGDGPGAARLALGAGEWRWGQLLRAEGAVIGRR